MLKMMRGPAAFVLSAAMVLSLAGGNATTVFAAEADDCEAVSEAAGETVDAAGDENAVVGETADAAKNDAAAEDEIVDFDVDDSAIDGEVVGIATAEVEAIDDADGTGGETVEAPAADAADTDAAEVSDDIPADDAKDGGAADEAADAEGSDTEAADTKVDAKDYVLVDKTLSATIYDHSEIDGVACDETAITLSGMMPEDAIFTAEPVDLHIEGETVLAAFDITIYDGDGDEYQPEAGAITVQMENDSIREAIDADADLTVYHMEDVDAEPEEVAVAEADDGTVVFDAESFSIYIVSDDGSLTGLDSGEETPTYTFYFYEYVWESSTTGGNETTPTPISVQTVTENEMLAEPATPEKEDYVFDGWYTVDVDNQDSDSTETAFQYDFSMTAGENIGSWTGYENEDGIINLYADYDTAYYVYYMDKAKDDSDVDNASVFYTQIYGEDDNTLDTSTASTLYYERYLAGSDSGKAATGWYAKTDTGAFESDPVEDGSDVAYDMYLYPGTADAIWINYDMNAGSDTSVKAPESTYVEAEAASIGTLPTPERDGYTFEGWYKTADCHYNDLVTSSASYETLSELLTDGGHSVTLYAKWIAHNVGYTIRVWTQKHTDGQEGIDQQDTSGDDYYNRLYMSYYDLSEEIVVSDSDSGLKPGETTTDINELLDHFIHKVVYEYYNVNTVRTEREMATITVAADGSTCYDIYMDRVVCTWYFYTKYIENNSGSMKLKYTMKGLIGSNTTVSEDNTPSGCVSAWPEPLSTYSEWGVVNAHDPDDSVPEAAVDPETTYTADGGMTEMNYYSMSSGIYGAKINFYKEVVDGDFYTGDTVTVDGIKFALDYSYVHKWGLAKNTGGQNFSISAYSAYNGYERYALSWIYYKDGLTRNTTTEWMYGTEGRILTFHNRSTISRRDVLNEYYVRSSYGVSLVSAGNVVAKDSEGNYIVDNDAEQTLSAKYEDVLTASELPSASDLDAATFGPQSDDYDYTFTGQWYLDQQCTVLAIDTTDSDSSYTMPDRNLTLYAGWEATPKSTEATVSFDLNGGSYSGDDADDGKIPDQTVTIGKLATAIDTSKLTKEGYTFAGWQYASGSRKGANFDFTMEVTGDTQLVAVWKATGDDATYSVTYYANLGDDGEGYKDSTTYGSGNTVKALEVKSALSEADLSEDQLAKFICWNTAADGSGTRYYADEEINLGYTDVNLYAVWAAEKTATLTLDYNFPTGYTNEALNGDTSLDVSVTNAESMTNISLATLFTTDDGDNGEESGGEDDGSSGDSLDTLFTYHHEITVEDDDGTIHTYRFAGWSEEKTDEDSASEDDVEVAWDATLAIDSLQTYDANTLYAVWTEVFSLDVYKTVVNDAINYDAADDTFTFTYSVTSPGDDDDIVTADGDAEDETITLKDGGHFTISDLSTGDTVIITEDEDVRYDTSYSYGDRTSSGSTCVYTIPVDFDEASDAITFTNTVKTTGVVANKVWDDKDDKDGLRPESVSVQLAANGEDFLETADLVADLGLIMDESGCVIEGQDGLISIDDVGDLEEGESFLPWAYVWTDLAEYDEDGNAIEYAVDETAVPEGYEKSIDTVTDAEYLRCEITNTHTPSGGDTPTPGGGGDDPTPSGGGGDNPTPGGGDTPTPSGGDTPSGDVTPTGGTTPSTPTTTTTTQTGDTSNAGLLLMLICACGAVAVVAARRRRA